MTVYSYSRINTYFTCPAQFQFRYIEKRPSPEAEGIELFLGSRFHETMEFLYRQLPQRIPTVREILEFFKTHWEYQWQDALKKQKNRNFKEPLRIIQQGQTVADYFQKGHLFVENYYHQYQPFDQDQTEGLELKVAFNLDRGGEYKMQGYLDRLGRDPNGTLWIHDYKTSSRKMSAEDARNEDQLALYQIGLTQNPNYGPKPKVKLAWHFVAFEKDLVVSERSPKEIEWLKDKYISKIKTVEQAKSYPPKPGSLCPWCEYLSICAEGKSWVESRKSKSESKSAKPERPIPLSIAEPAGGPVSSDRSPMAVVAPLAVEPQTGSSRKKAYRAASPDQLSLF
jgi:CRISPR/Cas system-associated exonuclease Cas4 (RecB family)